MRVASATGTADRLVHAVGIAKHPIVLAEHEGRAASCLDRIRLFGEIGPSSHISEAGLLREWSLQRDPRAILQTAGSGELIQRFELAGFVKAFRVSLQRIVAAAPAEGSLDVVIDVRTAPNGVRRHLEDDFDRKIGAVEAYGVEGDP